MLLQNTILQQPSTPPVQSCFRSQKPKRNSNAYGYHRLSMLSIPVRVPECPDSLLALLFMCRKLGQKLARNEWHCCPVLVNNPWRYSPSFTRANHWADSFDVFGIEECSSADWNLRTPVLGVNLPIILMECNGMDNTVSVFYF